MTSWHRKLGRQEDLPSDDGRCNRTIHLFAALHGHTPIGRNHGVRHRHLEAGNIRRAYLHHIRSTEVRSIGGHVANQRQHDNLHHTLQELLIAHTARHGADAITLKTNNGVLCTQRELRGRRSRPAVKAVKQRTRSAISIRNQIEHRERRHAIRVNVVGQERKIERDRNNRVRGVRHFNQGRGRCRDNDLRGKGDRHPRNDRFDRRSDQRDRRNRFGGKGWSRRKTRTQTEWNNNMHRDGRRPTHTYDHRNNFPREERCTEEPSSHSRRECPDDAKKVCTRMHYREMLHFSSQCLYGNGEGFQLLVHRNMYRV